MNASVETPPPAAANPKPKPLHAYMSKKKYEEIKTRISEMQDRDKTIRGSVDDIMRIICDIMQFDPEDKSYSQYKKDRLHKKAAAAGTSIYVASGNAVAGT